MRITIRPYTNSDFNEIVSWWKEYNEVAPLDGMMIEDGTFILEIGGIPALSLTVFLTQSKEISYLEGFIKNPKFKHITLEESGQILWNHCFKYAKDKGYKRVICLSNKEVLSKKYEKFGMIKICSKLDSFVKEL